MCKECFYSVITNITLPIFQVPCPLRGLLPPKYLSVRRKRYNFLEIPLGLTKVHILLPRSSDPYIFVTHVAA